MKISPILQTYLQPNMPAVCNIALAQGDETLDL